MIPIYRLAELRALEQGALAALPAGTLMQRAGARAAKLTLEIAGERPGEVLLLVGPGQNGGDALVAATHLRQRGIAVRVALLDAPEQLRGDARAAWQAWAVPGSVAQRDLAGLERASVVVDGLFGIGLNRAMPEHACSWAKSVNAWRRARRGAVLALDIPSGVSAETGAVLGCAIDATHTLSFLGAKPGLFTGDAPDQVGLLTIDTLGVERGPASGILNGPDAFCPALAPRRRASHKGQFGNLGVLAGARGMTGAGLLCARSALFAGAGRIYLQLPEGDLRVDLLHPELMLRDSLEDLDLQALAVGPGLGQGHAALLALERTFAYPGACVLDADGLNALAGHAHLRQRWLERSGARVITPHPLEAARLLSSSAAKVQSDRVGAALELATSLASITLLKGAGSIIAQADGRFAINPSGNPGLSSAGTGDVLTGLIGALLAQGLDAWHAALAGAWLHGAAADRLVADGHGPIGLSAMELLPAIRSCLNECVAALG